MFGFKKETPREKLEKKYKKLLDESYKLSHSNRTESDKMQAEAQAVLDEIDKLDK
jgi:hypothetical protein